MTWIRQVARSRVTWAVVALIVVVALIIGAAAIIWQSPAGGARLSPREIALVGFLVAVVAVVVGIARYGTEGYLASLWVFAPLLPVVAAAVSVATYLLIPATGDVPDRPADAVAVGICAALAAWAISAFPGSLLACRERAQTRVYGDLVQRYLVLDARADAEHARCVAAAAAMAQPANAEAPRADPPPMPKALHEARKLLTDVRDQLCSDKSGGPALRWALSAGYLGLTRQLHRAEEALMVVESVSELVGDVIHDDLSLEDSGLKNPFAMRRIIRDAMQVLSPGIEKSLLRPVPDLPRGTTMVTTTEAQVEETGTGGAPKAFTVAEAREALREVRFAINDYRDDIFDSFVRGRNQLIWTYLALAISTYVLLALGLLFGIPKVSLVSVSVLYLVASLIGLFNRLRLEASHTPKVDDYGLYVARLLTGPLLSGLAGVAGVYLIAQAPTFLGPLSTGDGQHPGGDHPGSECSPRSEPADRKSAAQSGGGSGCHHGDPDRRAEAPHRGLRPDHEPARAARRGDLRAGAWTPHDAPASAGQSARARPGAERARLGHWRRRRRRR